MLLYSVIYNVIIHFSHFWFNVQDPISLISYMLIITRLTKIFSIVKVDREGGSPMDISLQKIDENGFTATEQQGRKWSFISPCLIQASLTVNEGPNNTQV
ncbi:hypothetical protein Hanom_Chr14g01269031 [Helianthus anomalus]